MDDKNIWDIIDCHFRENPFSLVRHHIDSYNDFFKTDIFKMLKEMNPIPIVSKENQMCNLYIGGKSGQSVYFDKPEGRPLYPNEARLFNKTYEIPVYCDIEVELINNDMPVDYGRELEGGDEDLGKIENPKRFVESEEKEKGMVKELEKESKKPMTVNESKEISERVAKNDTTGGQIYNFTLKRVLLGRFPIMLNSDLCALSGMPKEMRFNLGECKNDLGGYFIIDGIEKTCPLKEDFSENTLRLVEDGIEINSVSENHSKKPAIFRISRSFHAIIPNVDKPIPLFILFRALGLMSDKEIIETCLMDLESDELMQCVYDAANIISQPDAIRYIAEFTADKSIPYTLMILSDCLLPHIGETNYMQKAFFIGHMTKSIGSTVGKEVLLPVVADVGKDMLKSYLTSGSGLKKRGRPRKVHGSGFFDDAFKGIKTVGKHVAPIAKDIAVPLATQALTSYMKGSALKKQPTRRNLMIRELMSKNNMSLPQASSYIKQHGLV
jgi:DNA-directed RNA polymerase II subunit RPB2